MVKVSVVVPIYNVELYLEECMDSIVNQTLTDIEIICINDGSTDNSLEILERYAEKDSRIQVITQENGGHAVATNRGMDLATGKYLFLMDSDDTLDLEALEKTYNAAEEKDVDFVLFKAINYDDSKDKYYESEFYSMNMLANRVGDNIFNFDDVGELALHMAVTPWTKLYNRKFIMDLGLRFPEGLIFEDNIFFWEVLLSAEKIYFLKEFLFKRRWYDSSSTKAGDKRFIDSIVVYSMIIDVVKHHNHLDDTFKRRLYNRKLFLAILRFKQVKEEFKDIYFQELQKNIYHFLQEDNLYDYLQNVLEPKNKFLLDAILNAKSAKELELIVYNYEESIKHRILERDNRYYYKVIHDNNDDLDHLITKANNYSNYVKDLQERNSKLNEENNLLLNEYNHEKELNNQISNSTFWKLTKPYRFLKDKIISH